MRRVMAVMLIVSLTWFSVPGAAALTEAPETDPPGEDIVDPAPPDVENPPVDETPDPVDDGADDESGDGGGNTVFLGLIAFLALALIGVLMMSGRSRGRTPTEVPTFRRPNPEPGPAQELLGETAWLHDQLSMEVLRGPADQAHRRWQNERSRIDAMTREAQQLAATTQRGEWRDLAASISTVGASIDSAIVTRLDASSDPSIVHETIEVVNRNRGQLRRTAALAKNAGR